MKILVAFVLLGAALAFYEDSVNVQTITDENFEKRILDGKDLWLINFYKTGDKASKKLSNEWESIARAFNGIIKVGAIDAGENEELATKYGIEEFPGVTFFANGETKNYSGKMNPKPISTFAIEQVEKHIFTRIGGTVKGTRSTEVQYEGDVTVLTVGNFEREVIMSEDMWLIEFYAPWCGHCKQLAPEWELAATELKGTVKLAKIDTTVEKSLGEKYEIKGFPTIKVFPPYDKEKPQDYQGGRTAPEIVEAALEYHSDLSLLPSISELSSVESFEKECEDHSGNCLIAFVPEDDDVILKTVRVTKMKFKKGKRPKFLWAKIGKSEELDEIFSIKADATKIIGVDADTKEYSVYKGSFETEALIKWSKAISKKAQLSYTLPKDDL